MWANTSRLCGKGGFLWIPFKQQAHTNHQSISVSPSCIIPFYMPPFQLILRALDVVCLNDARCSHWQNGTHATPVWIHTVVCLGTADVRPPGASVCVFFFLVICFGHSNVWCASTQQSHCHTHTLQTHACLRAHTLFDRPSSTCPNCSTHLTFSLTVVLSLLLPLLLPFLLFGTLQPLIWDKNNIISHLEAGKCLFSCL